MPKKTAARPDVIESAPETLKSHMFFGFKLDAEQEAFRDAIWNKDKLIVFADAKAGTGKTTIATLTAELLVKYERGYDGIVYITSPTQEQTQGYLPGDIDEKSEPYFEGLRQALIKANVNPYTAIANNVMNLKKGSGYVWCVTQTFLRGVNFENKVVIIDECQNINVPDLNKILTRMHDNCKVVVIGHFSQRDNISEKQSGFRKYMDLFDGDSRTAICKLTKNYRGWIATRADQIYDSEVTI